VDALQEHIRRANGGAFLILNNSRIIANALQGGGILHGRLLLKFFDQAEFPKATDGREGLLLVHK
jgi:hypothetical protein